MKVLSLLWGYSLGGIGKVALTYGKIGDISDIDIITVVIQPNPNSVDLSSLQSISSRVIKIKNKLELSWIKKLKEVINNYQPDILFVHGFNGPIIALFLKKFLFRKLSIVCSYHGRYNAPTPIKKIFEPIYNGLPIFIYKSAACNKVITVCEYFEKQLNIKGVTKSKTITIHNGINMLDTISIPNNRLKTKSNLIKIGFVGRLDPIKGLDILMKALYELEYNMNSTNWELIVVGNGPLFDTINTQIKKLNIADKVNLMGEQNNIANLLNEFDIFVLPSLLEAHSISLLEAMRAGKAIIATNVGGNPESIRNGIEGVLVPPKRPKELAKALYSLIQDQDLRLKYGNAAQKRFQDNFTEKVILKKLVNCFNSF